MSEPFMAQLLGDSFQEDSPSVHELCQSDPTWPPSPSRFPPSLEDDTNSTDDDDADAQWPQENPLMYFLTPPTPGNEDLEFDFEFDAGIEDSNRPREIIRTVSPSTLDGLRKYKPKDKLADCAVLDDDDDDDEEDYIRFHPHGHTSLPFGFEKFFDQTRSTATITTQTTEALLSPASFHVGSPKGRPSKRFAPPRRALRGRSPTQSLQRRHSWREPSPDVYSIEEEPEKETMSEMGLSIEDLTDDQDKKTQPIDIPAAKPRKKVRFVLPVKD
ncbi:uncharacterized protein F4822DRAFT_427174 [Hypoxylon trugodes]|uniref:uncharacterized protein n=1 Tax=Hypoxylon trugodes TaxID=326681 RepID=UPI002197970B|nr:uncharacterized protein F4822DRAFT_427174 [Hypoxylon trugodes]KAI1391325.1 hypothetical protein F4822DRAFT_427174 [Hypoxylon trugodes]